ncbi:NusG domain II-containing protein [Sporohalobacter salinus]|uniref:NusG domain II-containing protein n=1 Tax=Sporohalobacter salinus TaxID=1494606 RepID=UPI00196135EB|nr:NusG domain II-containing protein [Sporohalobacter salinus]MBM7624675.1 hypothetical protein [Sporohalobacter salinus]
MIKFIGNDNMFQNLRNVLTLYDKVLIIFILLTTVVGISWSISHLVLDSQSTKYVIIEHKGQTLNKLRLASDLERKITIDLDSGKAEVMIRDGKVRMLEMSEDICPLGICSDTGWISKPGNIIVCIPNQIIIAIEAQDSIDKIDAISY